MTARDLAGVAATEARAGGADYDECINVYHANSLVPAGLAPLVERAANALLAARTSAEVLDARIAASIAYDASQKAARLLKAKGAHDSLIAAAHRAQADALEIEAQAKRRLADEYDAAQERGEVAKQGKPSTREGFATAADLGITHKEIHEAREIRDAEKAEPGFVRRVLDERLGAGQEPTKASVRHAIEERKNVHVANNSGNNEWYTPDDILERARKVLGGFDLDPASSAIANERVRAERFFTAEDDGLTREWAAQRIWMNPPYAQPLIGQFCEKFAAECEAGAHGIALVNNATETAWFQRLAGVACAICFPRARIRFVDPDGNQSGAPLQGQAIIYAGDNAGKFCDAFDSLGFVVFT